MRILLITTMLTILFTASTCQKQTSECHHTITIINNSSDSIIHAIPMMGVYGCRLDGEMLRSGDKFIYQASLKSCLEDILPYRGPEVIYIIDPLNFNEPDVYYSCDSFYYHNTILRKYILDIDTLRKLNFEVNYP